MRERGVLRGKPLVRALDQGLGIRERGVLRGKPLVRTLGHSPVSCRLLQILPKTAQSLPHKFWLAATIHFECAPVQT